MNNVLLNPLVLRGLYSMAMGKAFLRFRDPRRRKSGQHHTEFYENTWRDAAEKLGGSWRRLCPGIAEIEIDGRKTRVDGSVCEIDSPVTLALVHDKPLTHRLLSEDGLCVPRHAVFSLKQMRPAIAFMAISNRDCVVKPAGGTGGGRGVTTGISRASHLARAAAAAAVYADELMIEEQIAGDNYRLLYLDGQLIDSFVRRLPTVMADGRSTVAGLVRQANDERLKQGTGISQVLLSIDLDMRRTLAKQNLKLRSVPAAGTRITLKTVVNENGGADNTTATPLLCPSIIEAGAKAAQLLRIRFAGIDIVTRDPSLPLAESGGVILEVNATPNLYYHYHKSDGCFPVAEHLLRRLLRLDENGNSYSQRIMPDPIVTKSA
jgi:D-alanine-D-alanine ligase-like ATP-grasp enzyme